MIEYRIKYHKASTLLYSLWMFEEGNTHYQNTKEGEHKPNLGKQGELRRSGE